MVWTVAVGEVARAFAIPVPIREGPTILGSKPRGSRIPGPAALPPVGTEATACRSLHGLRLLVKQRQSIMRLFLYSFLEYLTVLLCIILVSPSCI